MWLEDHEHAPLQYHFIPRKWYAIINDCQPYSSSHYTGDLGETYHRAWRWSDVPKHRASQWQMFWPVASRNKCICIKAEVSDMLTEMDLQQIQIGRCQLASMELHQVRIWPRTFSGSHWSVCPTILATYELQKLTSKFKKEITYNQPALPWQQLEDRLMLTHGHFRSMVQHLCPIAAT